MCPSHIENVAMLQKQQRESSKIISESKTACPTCTIYIEEILKLQNQLKRSSQKISRLQQQIEKSKIKWENALNTIVPGLLILFLWQSEWFLFLASM